MTSRICLLVAACLCAAFLISDPALAQERIPLRASYQGEFLPEGTEIIVLTEPGRHLRAGRYQPEFFPARDFPRTSSSRPRRDHLDATGHTNGSYAATQESGRLYFVYALAPDSTLYWSYSARRDSLKYDVVSTGVMSVAPVPSPDVRDAVMRTFFRPRVQVIMLGQGKEKEEEEEEGEASLRVEHVDRGDAEAGDAEFGINKLADVGNAGSADVRSGGERSGTEVGGASFSLEPTAAHSDVPPVASRAQIARTGRRGVMLPPMLVWGLLLLVLAAVGVPVYFAREARNELRQVRREMIALRGRMTGAPDEVPGGETAGTTRRRTGQGDPTDPDPDSPWK